MTDREELTGRMLAAGRELSTAVVLFHSALAAHQGLNATDVKTLDLLERLGPLTARQLSARSGLAPASVTGMVDRLEARGFVRRVPNPADGRSVLIESRPEGFAPFAHLFDGLVTSLVDLASRYDDTELAVIVDYLHEAAARQRDAALRLSGSPSD